MNILYLAEGLDRSETAYILRIAEKGHVVEAMLPPQAEAGALEAAGLRITRLPFGSRIDRPTIQGLRERLQQGGIDVIHCLRNNRPLANALWANRRTRIPIVAYRGTMGHLSRWNPGAWMTYLHPRIACVTCVSDAVRNYLQKQGVPDARLKTVYKGHDPAWYSAAEPVDLAAAGLPAEAFVVCCAANMRPVKGIDVLIQALHYLPAESRVHLLLVGDVLDDRIPRLAGDPAVKHRIHLTGFQKNAPAWSAASDVFVMPSIKREGLPRAVIEAMSRSIPPLVTAVGGMPELVEHQQSGWVVPPSDAPALAAAMVTLEQDAALRARLGRGAHARIEGPFSIERTVTELLNCYRAVTGGPAPQGVA